MHPVAPRTKSRGAADVLSRLHRARIPPPTLQHEVFDDTGFVARVDFAWVPQRIALFADGWRFHDGRVGFEHDHQQRARLTAAGWSWVEVTAALVESGSWLEALGRLLTLARAA